MLFVCFLEFSFQHSKMGMMLTGSRRSRVVDHNDWLRTKRLCDAPARGHLQPPNLDLNRMQTQRINSRLRVERWPRRVRRTVRQ